MLSYGFRQVLLSGLGDRIAPLRLLTGMMVVWCILMVIMGFTHNYALMVTLRILLGIAEGPLFPLAFAVVRHTFPQRLTGPRHHAVAARHAGWRGAGFPLSIWLLNTFGWQSTFFVMAMLTIPVLIFCTHRAARRTTGGERAAIKPRRKRAAARVSSSL